MEDIVIDLLSSCCDVDFGTINISEGEEEFSRELNHEIISLCKTLPESTQTEAVLFLIQYLRTSLEKGLDFVKYFHVPAWSTIYWLIQSCTEDKRLRKADIRNSKTGHSMAMLLHALDDHLTDGQLPSTHLALLLRSQSWMIMNHAFNSLADEVDKGEEMVRGFINDYYSSIRGLGDVRSLNSYCKLFRRQMATALIVPVLLARKMTANREFANAIQIAYGSFGIAWRLLDDIQDLERDMMKGVHSSIYICLSDETRDWWNKDTEEKRDKNNGYKKAILSFVLEHRVIDRIKERICTELESAASIADFWSVRGLADELRCLLRPLRNGRTNYE